MLLEPIIETAHLSPLAACAAEAEAIGREMPPQEALRPRIDQLAARLRSLHSGQLAQRITAGRARAKLDEERNGHWRARALAQAQLLRLADPELSQMQVAEALKEAFGDRLPKLEAIVRHVRAWERKGALARRRASVSLR